jgi:hypothetical protein
MVFCCNLLFDHRSDISQFIMGKMRSCLSPKGYLVTGEAERAIVERAGGFRAVAPPSAVLKNAELRMNTDGREYIPGLIIFDGVVVDAKEMENMCGQRPVGLRRTTVAVSDRGSGE